MKNLARRILRAFYAARLRRKSRPLALSTGGILLVLAPHPDDEALGCGALLARRTAAGEHSVVAYFTNGEGSHSGHPTLLAPELAALRQAEARRAMEGIGIPAGNLRFLGAPDGRLNSLSQEEKQAWVARLRDLLGDVRPSELMLPCRDDGSSEHEAMFSLVIRALAGLPPAPPRVLEFPVWSWWSPRHLGRVVGNPRTVWSQPVGEFATQKRALLKCYPSQTEPTAPFTDPMLPRPFVAAFDTAEEFFLESPLP
jgi:LmbE family N-acetylglucosaminyl deacetylase